MAFGCPFEIPLARSQSHEMKRTIVACERRDAEDCERATAPDEGICNVAWLIR
jgi:hypothetical protein